MYTITVEADSRRRAKALVEEMCKRLLANPTKDDYAFKVEVSK